MEENEKVQHKLPSQEIDYIKIVKILLSRWYWVVGSVLVFVIGANVYLWYTPKIYATYSTMKFEDKRSEISGISELAAPADRVGASRIQSEISVLQSTPLLLSAIKQLDYRISYYVVGRILNRTNEMYPNKPINVQMVRFDTLNFYHGIITYIPVNDRKFTISYKEGAKDIRLNCTYDVPFSVGPTAFSIRYPGPLAAGISFQYKVNAPEDFLGRVAGGFHAAETARNSNIIGLQETDSNPQFAADILNAIMKEYLDYDLRQRTLSTKQMINFIDNQLAYLGTQVKGSSNNIQRFQENKKIMDVGAAATEVAGKAKDIESQISALKVQLIAVDELKQQIVTQKDNSNFSLNLGGLVDAQLDAIIQQLNSLLVEKNSLLKTFLPQSPQIKDIDHQILQAKNDVLSSLQSQDGVLERKIKYLNTQLTPINQQINEMPGEDQAMVSLKRDFEINDKVYSFLSEKKLDAEINSASILPGATILQNAQPNFFPISPVDSSVRRSAVIFGLIIGLGAIILIRLLNPYIYDKETIESLTAIPIIGVIRKFPEAIDEYSSQILAISKPKSIFAESVRSVRTNLSFLATDIESKVICVTSEVAGEGKSFVTVNLSSTLSLIDKRVILIASDLRRSKLHKTFDVPNDIGLSNYLAGQCELRDIIRQSKQHNLDFIVSGPVPPNPSELLHSKRMEDAVRRLQAEYDIVMIDTAPIGLVSDAVPLIKLSHINLFIIRSGKSKFYSATVPARIAQEYHLDNTCIILNAYSEDLLHSRYYTTKFTGENYGARYYYYSDYTGYESSGYYTDDEHGKWWAIKRWFKR